MTLDVKKLFFLSAIIVLTLTAAGKIYSTLGRARVLDQVDELLLLSNRSVLTLVGTIELITVGIIIFNKIDRIRLLLLLWLSSMFASYRLANWYFQIPNPCKCLGVLTERLPFKQQHVEFVMELIVAYLFVGSVSWLLIEAWRSRRIRDC